MSSNDDENFDGTLMGGLRSSAREPEKAAPPMNADATLPFGADRSLLPPELAQPHAAAQDTAPRVAAAKVAARTTAGSQTTSTPRPWAALSPPELAARAMTVTLSGGVGDLFEDSLPRSPARRPPPLPAHPFPLERQKTPAAQLAQSTVVPAASPSSREQLETLRQAEAASGDSLAQLAARSTPEPQPVSARSWTQQTGSLPRSDPFAALPTGRVRNGTSPWLWALLIGIFVTLLALLVVGLLLLNESPETRDLAPVRWLQRRLAQ